jgi:acyl CoA:acetate/3-ketoacid CoA transferase beta subunit
LAPTQCIAVVDRRWRTGRDRRRRGALTRNFFYWLQAGRIDVGFLGAAQIDRFGNLNTTVIGGYGKPKTRLPGAGGAPEIALHAKKSLWC